MHLRALHDSVLSKKEAETELCWKIPCELGLSYVGARREESLVLTT